MASSVKQLIEAANARVPRVSPMDAKALIATQQALVVDVRDAAEVAQSGQIAGSIHVSRGLLEFRADPESPLHDPRFSRERPVILYCASGGRAALAGRTLQELGYEQVFNLGAFKDWPADDGVAP